MGFVPSRTYTGLKGGFEKGVIWIPLPSNVDDSWFFEHLWLKSHKAATIGRAGQPETEPGCWLVIAQGEGIRNNDWDVNDQFDNLVVNITAQGMVTIAIFNDQAAANRLRRAFGRPETNEAGVALSFL